MDINLEARGKQLKELNEFITATRKKILHITDELQWDVKTLDSKQEMVSCPFDPGHVIPKTSLQKHIEKCTLKKESYHPEDIMFPPLSVENNAPSVLHVDNSLQASILKQAKLNNPSMLIGNSTAEDDRSVPQSSDRFMSLLTSDERAALHAYVVANTISPSQEKDLSLAEQDLEKNFKERKEEAREKTRLETLIEERNAKRRKEGKKVHINRKSHLEIIREVIENQMEIYVEWLKDENLIKKEEIEPGEIEPSEDTSEKEVNEVGFVKSDRESVSRMTDYEKAANGDEKKKRFVDDGDKMFKDRRRDRDAYADNRKRNEWETGRDYQSRYDHPRESGSKRHGGYESTSHRDRKHDREYDHRRHGGKYHSDERKGDHDRYKSSKHGVNRYWDDGYCVPKEEEYSEDNSDAEKSVDTPDHYRRESNGKHEKERRHHKSKRRHRSRDREGGSKSKRCKKERH